MPDDVGCPFMVFNSMVLNLPFAPLVLFDDVLFENTMPAELFAVDEVTVEMSITDLRITLESAF
jgi:hypothetical protein